MTVRTPTMMLAGLGLSGLLGLPGPASGARFNYLVEDVSGYIRTPQYPDNYPSNADVYWQFVRAENTDCIKFTVEDFDVVSENEILCPEDSFVLESCGSWETFAPERQICGNLSSVIASRGPFTLFQFYDINATSLRVSFHSDSSLSSSGILMQYEMLGGAECSKYGGARASRVTTKSGEIPCIIVEEDPVGHIQTLGYPSPYPPDLACVYAFKKPTPEYCGVFIDTTKFDLEEKDLGGRCHDYFSKPGCAKFCGAQKSSDSLFFEYQPGSDIMSFQFESDFSSEGRGFLMNYVQLKECFNPHQPGCPNNKLSRTDDASNECYEQDQHDCHADQQCQQGQICCFDGCYRRCVNPELNLRKRRNSPFPSMPRTINSGILRYPDQPKFWYKEERNNNMKISQNMDKWNHRLGLPDALVPTGRH